MSASILHRLLGIGRVRPVVRETLEDEGFLVLDEGIRLSVDYRGHREAGGPSWRKKRFARGALVLTQQRLIAFAWSRRILSVRLDDPRLARLSLGLESPGVLTVTVDASLFHDDREGEVVYRFETAHAPEILEILEARRRGSPA